MKPGAAKAETSEVEAKETAASAGETKTEAKAEPAKKEGATEPEEKKTDQQTIDELLARRGRQRHDRVIPRARVRDSMNKPNVCLASAFQNTSLLTEARSSSLTQVQSERWRRGLTQV